MLTLSRHPRDHAKVPDHALAGQRDHARAGQTAAAVAGVALLSLVLAGCGQLRAGSGGSGQPPQLHLATGSGSMERAAILATAPVAVNGVGFGGWVLAGPLPDQPTHAAVRRWPAGAADPAAVKRLARTLGVTGTPVRHAHGWVVTGTTGELRIQDGGGHPWSYARADRAGCAPTIVDVDQPAGAGGAGCGVAISSGQTPPSGPKEPVARAIAAPLLAALGQAPSDVAAARVSVGYPDSTLSVSPTLDGVPTQGLETTVYVDRSGIAAANGRLDRPVPGDVYPLRTAKQAFDDLANDPLPLMAPFCGPIPGATDSNHGGAAPPVTCPSPVPVRITGARIGLLLTYDFSGNGRGGSTPIMVPAWFFTVADGTGPAVIAIDPSFLAPPDQLQPGTVTDPPGGVPAPGPAMPPSQKPGATPYSPGQVGAPASPNR